MDSIDTVKKLGLRAKGQNERIRYIECKPLTRKEAMLAHCYDCTGGYADGVQDCGMETCSMYAYMPYRRNKEITKRERSEKQKENDGKLSLLRSTGKRFIGHEETQDDQADIYPEGTTKVSDGK